MRPNCRIEQDDFEAELARNNVIFRIPTPVFGSGLMENDFGLDARSERGCELRTPSRALGISGR